MTCAESDTLISNLLAGDITPSERVALNDHLAICDLCRDEVEAVLAAATSLDRMPDEQPSPEMRIRFYQMLEQNRSKELPRPGHGWEVFGKVAALVMLVGGGFLAGFISRGGTGRTQLASDPELILMRQGGEDMRLAGVMLASQGDPDDPLAAKPLLNLLEHDPSESVRLAAVDALYLYGNQPRVREQLAASLSRQGSTRVQLALVDLLAGLRERRAVEAIRELIANPRTSPEVARRMEAKLRANPL